MLAAPKTQVKDLIENEKNWTELVSTPEVMTLLRQHRIVCEQEIEFLDSQGYIDSKMAFPRKFLNKYFLYAHLRKHKRVPRCSHAEMVLKKSATKGK